MVAPIFLLPKVESDVHCCNVDKGQPPRNLFWTQKEQIATSSGAMRHTSSLSNISEMKAITTRELRRQHRKSGKLGILL
jgi:hypothetical protein